jgi:hypothetical protein
MTRRSEKRGVRVEHLELIETWLQAASAGFTSTGYSVQSFVDMDRQLEQGLSPVDVTDDNAENKAFAEVKKMDELMPRVLVAIKHYPSIGELIFKIGARSKRLEIIVDELDPIMNYLWEVRINLGSNNEEYKKVTLEERITAKSQIELLLDTVKEARELISFAYEQVSEQKKK